MFSTLRKIEKCILFFEHWGPLILSLVLTLIYLLLSFNNKIEFKDNISDIMSSVISVSSVLIGFLGVIITIILTVTNNPIKQGIFESEHYNKLFISYTLSAIVSGLLLIILCLILLFQKTMLNISIFIFITVKYLWIFMIIFFLISTSRILLILFRIMFYNSNINNSND